jgi:hypothetical protein
MCLHTYFSQVFHDRAVIRRAFCKINKKNAYLLPTMFSLSYHWTTQIIKICIVERELAQPYLRTAQPEVPRRSPNFRLLLAHWPRNPHTHVLFGCQGLGGLHVLTSLPIYFYNVTMDSQSPAPFSISRFLCVWMPHSFVANSYPAATVLYMPYTPHIYSAALNPLPSDEIIHMSDNTSV